MNKCTIIGNLCRDPAVRQVNTANGPVNVCDFTVAVNDRNKKDENGQPVATFFRCSAWRGLADVVAKYAAKGTKVAVTGPVSARAYTANDGTAKAQMEINVEDFEFCSSRSDSQSSGQAAQAPAPAPSRPIPDFTPVDDGSLPF